MQLSQPNLPFARMLLKPQRSDSNYFEVFKNKNANTKTHTVVQYFFMCLVAYDKIQRGLDEMTHNKKGFKEVVEAMTSHGYHQSNAGRS